MVAGYQVFPLYLYSPFCWCPNQYLQYGLYGPCGEHCPDFLFCLKFIKLVKLLPSGFSNFPFHRLTIQNRAKSSKTSMQLLSRASRINHALLFSCINVPTSWFLLFNNISNKAWCRFFHRSMDRDLNCSPIIGNQVCPLDIKICSKSVVVFLSVWW